MSTGINIASSSDLTVGTTAVTSGTNGRVFFQAGGVVQQDANFTFDNTLKRLALKAVGTAGTDIPLSISNSAGTLNLFQVSGNSAYFNGPAATAFTPIFALYRNNLEVFRIDEYKSQFTGNVYMNSIVGPASSGITFQNQSGSGKLIHMVPTGGTLAIGYGTLTTAAALDVKAQGALSTDIAFRVRNSADSANFFAVQGNGDSLFGNPTHGLLVNNQTLGNSKLDIYTYATLSTSISPSVSYFGSNGLSPNKGIAIGYSATTLAAPLDVIDVGFPTVGKSVARFGNFVNDLSGDNFNLLFSTRYSGVSGGNHLAKLTVGQTGSGASLNAKSYFKFELIRNNTLAERASITSQSNLLLQTPTEDTNDVGVIYIPNGTAPTAILAGGGKLYVEGGALKYIGSAGTISVIAPA